MVDYFSFQAGSAYPTLLAVLYTVLLAFLLSTSIAFTYYFTTVKGKQSKDFFQALVLAAVVAATVMQAIGDSLAIGLGMLGALAIIRFRTNLENPRDIIFMFAALAAGLACGVYGFTISVVGTIGFCLVALLLKLTPIYRDEEVVARFRFRLPFDSPNADNIKTMLNTDSQNFILEEMRVREAVTSTEDGTETPKSIEYNYKLFFKDEKSYKKLVDKLSDVSDIQEFRINLLRTR